MVRHVVVFTWKPEVTDEELRALTDGLAALPGRIPEILSYAFGPDLRLGPGNDEFGLVADFADVDAYTRYVEHPAHRQLLEELLRPILGSRHAVQIQLEG